MKNRYRNLVPMRRPQSARGVVLLVALVVLLVMTLTALALVRTTTTGSSIAGSLAFKQTATTGADLGLEHGLAQLDQLSQNSAALDGNNASAGYFAQVDPKIAAKDLAWSSARQATADDGLGNQVHYMIHRLCSSTGPWNASGQSCVAPQSTGCPGSSDSPGGVLPCNDRPMYRITARALGPRETLSYVQMTVY
ncbi:MAG: hypothetical protein RR749_11555 [Comamonas sp.]